MTGHPHNPPGLNLLDATPPQIAEVLSKAVAAAWAGDHDSWKRVQYLCTVLESHARVCEQLEQDPDGNVAARKARHRHTDAL